MEGFGNTPVLITNDNDDPPQLQLKDTMDNNLVWKGQFMHKAVSRKQILIFGMAHKELIIGLPTQFVEKQ
jgi:hypothetical protein